MCRNSSLLQKIGGASRGRHTPLQKPETTFQGGSRRLFWSRPYYLTYLTSSYFSYSFFSPSSSFSYFFLSVLSLNYFLPFYFTYFCTFYYFPNQLRVFLLFFLLFFSLFTPSLLFTQQTIVFNLCYCSDNTKGEQERKKKQPLDSILLLLRIHLSFYYVACLDT
ncbi:hypothetical protein F4809DRAFT_335910 [Biscogniauxia mediterranea]|nr:hypothetical protein F4809DRAFT_335910 [Biscogniauxia mediterranea]